MRLAIEARRIEEAGLNALQTQRQLFYDGWLLRLSPGKARRARSVNAHFGSLLPLAEKIAYCERAFEARRLPTLFRITPFVQPPELAGALAARGYAAFDNTLVQAAALDRPPEFTVDPAVSIERASIAQWVDAVAALRGSTPEQRAAHLERAAHSPLDPCGMVATCEGATVAAGQFTREDTLAGIYDVVTDERWRGRGVATALVGALLAKAWERGAQLAYLQVDEGNAPALAIYRKFGFATIYTYHYMMRPGDEH